MVINGHFAHIAVNKNGKQGGELAHTTFISVCNVVTETCLAAKDAGNYSLQLGGHMPHSISVTIEKEDDRAIERKERSLP